MSSLDRNYSGISLSRIFLLGVSILALGTSINANLNVLAGHIALSNAIPLTTYKATYHATFDRFSGKATMGLKKNPDTDEYIYSSVTKPRGVAALMGKIREWSVFTLDNSKVVPKIYTHKSRDKQNIIYDWSAKKAKSTADGKNIDLNLKGNELDLMSLQMQLKLDLKKGDLKESYTIINDNKIKTYMITPLEKENVTVDGKTYLSQKIKQQRTGSSRHNYLWLAEDIDFTLVKMQQYKGEKLRGTLTMTGYKADNVATAHN